jgi:hypothetical protein
LEKPCKTMEVIVNTVVLSTDRACRGIRHVKNRLEINLSGGWPIFGLLKTRVPEISRTVSSLRLLVAGGAQHFSSAAERDR